jgi:hypothetical protein
VRITFSAAVLLSVFSLTARAQSGDSATFQQVHAFVTGYNTVPEQTSPTPCIAASGGDICGRTDVVACPRRIKLGTYLQIRGATYVCEDRLAKKYDSRFDISCDKDFDCPFQVTGWTDIKVYTDIKLDDDGHRQPVVIATISAPSRNAVASAARAAAGVVAQLAARRTAPVRRVAVLRGRTFRRV